MIRAGGEHFNALLHDVFDTVWELEVQPKAWQYSLLQPIHKGGTKPKPDPASYRGIFLCSALSKLFEGIMNTRLTKFTEAHCTMTDNQLGIRPGRNAHDAIYSLLSLIQYNLHQRQRPTYVAFIDYTTAFPSVSRDKLLCLLFESGITGRMWKHLRERFRTVYIRVLHPDLAAHAGRVAPAAVTLGVRPPGHCAPRARPARHSPDRGRAVGHAHPARYRRR